MSVKLAILAAGFHIVLTHFRLFVAKSSSLVCHFDAQGSNTDVVFTIILQPSTLVGTTNTI